jgi:hypothetical protein
MKQELLRRRVVKLLADGTLPRHRNPPVIAGYGDDLPCDVCGEPIAAHEVQYDIEDSGPDHLHVHLNCHRAWQNALADVQAEQRR